MKNFDTASLQVSHHSDRNSYVVQLEKNGRDLIQLGKKLSSYLCEPRTYNLFERSQFLRSRLDQLLATNRQILKMLREPKKSWQEVKDITKRQISDFRELQQGIDEYIQLSRY